MDFPSIPPEPPALSSRQRGVVQRTTSPVSEQSRVEKQTDRLPNYQRAITKEETEFFERLFPAAANEIRVHRVYDRTGIKDNVLVGTVIDRKG
jgi:hypothetical protein